MVRKSLNKKTLWFLFVLLLFVGSMMGGQTAVTHAADNSWQAQYWNNRTLSGSPVVVRQDSNIDFDWGDGVPVPILNKDAFSARWTRLVYFTAGTYRFTATTDDGMRVWVDNSQIIDSWWDSQVHSLSFDITLGSGDHPIKVEYYEAGGKAVAKLNWVMLGGSVPGAYANWKGEYFNNMSLAGQPVLVRDDANINFNWGVGSPEWNIVPSDRFSVRWTRSLNLTPGRYKFTTIADDGARLWVNGQLVIDKWLDSNSGTYLVELDLPGGSTSIQMEYYENLGGAVARFDWLNLSSGGINVTNWRGEYFNNKFLSGNPVLTRDDSQVNFNWGAGSAAAGIVNNDNFSVRWTRSLNFNSGRYRFTVTSDDGVRVWVNNQTIIDKWYDHPPQTFSGEIDLPNAMIPIRVEFYDSTGGAQIQFSWINIGAGTPPPTPSTSTGTVVSPRLNVRTGPGTQYSIIHVLSSGQTVNLAGYRSSDNLWVMINWNGSTAWVSSLPNLLYTTANVGNMPVWQGTVPGTGGPSTSPTATVGRVYYLNMRSGPGVTNPVIKVVSSGTVVTLLGRNSTSTWAKVRLNDGTIGWVSAYYLISSTSISSLPLA